MSTYLKTLVRTFRKHITRFLSIIFIVLVSVGFISGLGGSTNKIDQSLSRYYKTQNVSDFIVKSKQAGGFSQDEIEKVRKRYGGENVNFGNSVDVKLTVGEEEQLVRLYFLDEKQTVNIHTPQKSDGEAPAVEVENPVLSEKKDNALKGFVWGTQITVNFKDVLSQLAQQSGEAAPQFPPFLSDEMTSVTVTVTGETLSPLTFALDGEPSYLNPPETEVPQTIGGLKNLIVLDNILYLSTNDIPAVLREAFPQTGDLYIALPNRNVFDAFSHNYKLYLEREEAALKSVLDHEFEIITLCDNYSFVSLHAYGKQVMDIGMVMMVVFLLITALVVDSNMTRLMEEERSQIACLRTLGYGGFRITLKYLLFALIATIVGGAGSYFVGLGLADLIYYVFNYSFVMPPMSGSATLWFFFVICAAIIVTALAATVFSGVKKMKTQPAELLRPRPPRAGKKVFLEKIPFIWKRLSFKYKSTVRNVLRFKSRFFMTLIAVAGSMGLILAGISLFDMCLLPDFGSPALMWFAAIIVVFAALLTAAVIYTLTNINISERNREIATLMVLGYQDSEVAGYIYREIYLNTAVGILFGYPVGALLLSVVFSIIPMGSFATMSWFVWLIAPLFVLIATALVTLILRRKIVKINMNESLKAIE